MGKLILTGLTKQGGHDFELKYLLQDNKQICKIICRCGYETELIHHDSYAGVKELERIWNYHLNQSN